MNAFKNVVEKLKSLETERRNLLLEIEELKKMADSRAKALENEVGMLREEVKSLRILLGSDEPELPPEPKRKK
jgi:regulator of replication initiation timing